MLGEIISEAIDDTQALARIRPDLNIEKWTIWQPAKSHNPPSARIFEREITLPDGSKLTAQVEIGFTQHGTITTEEQKTYWALVKCWEDKGCPTEFTLFSRREMAKLLKKKWGTNVLESLTRSLRRLRVTPIAWRNSYYDSTTGETVAELTDFTILSKLKIIEREKHGVVNQAVGYFQFDEHIFANLSNNYTKPLLFDTAISFRSEIAQLLYPHVDLVMADKYKYERRTKELFKDLGLTGRTYAYPSKRKEKLELALKELEGKPLSTGVLVSATLVKTSDGKDYKVVFIKKARRTSRKKSQVTAECESVLVHELYERGIRPESKASELAGKNPVKLVEQWLEIYDLGLIQIGGLRDALEHGWQPSAEQLKEVAQTKRAKGNETRNQKITKLEEEREEIEKARWGIRQRLLDEIMNADPKVIEEAVERSENPYAIGRATDYGTVYEAYEKSPIFQSEVERIIREEMYREKFDETERNFNERIDTVDQQIEALQDELKVK